ncbi:MAG: 4-hydroxy-3-methylbut-2-enyl diphosphate reductase [Desulfamplus sp.]|nr:4-hydroxy-3-methylbut-2-enyl diphosphate reductase [Desulfamplus sp.]
MKITIAKTAGFCMGVRRAVDMVLDAANTETGTICTFGPLIHNPQVLAMLKEKGIPYITRIPDKAQGTVLIRAHGVPPQSRKALEDAGFHVIDATCPRVTRVQSIIEKHAKKGFHTIIIGDHDHPEVKGLMGYARERAHTVSSMDDLAALPIFARAVVVAQTTQDTLFYKKIKSWASENCPQYKIFDTICDSTEKRQAEVRKIAGENDAVIVVGGRESGNTRRLAEIAHETAEYSLHIEDPAEIEDHHIKALSQADSIAVTAGASTPNWIINRTFRTLEDNLLTKSSNPFTLPARKIRDFLLKTNLLLAFGAASLTYTCSRLQNIENIFIHSIIAMLYILSMQIMNNLFAIPSDRYNNPGRALFYGRHKVWLALTAIASGAAGIYLSFSTSILSFVIIVIMSLLGLLYNQKLFKATFRGRKISRIKDIPGSKTVLIALAWGTVSSLLPLLSTWGPESLSLAFAVSFTFTTAILFARTAFFALMDIQGDRISGKETLPILLGEKKSERLISRTLLFAALLMATAPFFNIVPYGTIFMAFIPLSMLYVVKAHEKRKIYSGMNLEFIMESQFLISGLIALVFL